MAKNTTIGLSFKPKEITKKMLAILPERSRNVLAKRYGLYKSGARLTLEAIGSEYGITRERVRQIENFGLNLIKKSKVYAELQNSFDELKKVMENFGGVVHEQEFLEMLADDREARNHVHFMLVVADAFTKIREDDEFHHRWTVDQELATRVHQSLRKLCSNFSEGDLVSEPELVARFLKELDDFTDDPKIEEFAKKWLSICKLLSKNPLGEWGLSSSPNVKMRGIRDFAYLVLRQSGKPMHFAEVAKQIRVVFGKDAHSATCHNELIKDDRFVLVGRGLYALKEWGYSKGTVIDVITDILKKEGPQTKTDIIEKVLKQRLVKENTILVNLQNMKYFKKDAQGRYALAQ